MYSFNASLSRYENNLPAYPYLFALTDLNPQQFVDINHAKGTDFIKETIKVYHNSSEIFLPVIQ
jgi:hypothetical protein